MITEKLIDLITYYQMTRGVGHTQGMLEGANYTDNALILTSNGPLSYFLKSQIGSPKSVYVTPYNSRVLRGHRRPLFIDNAELCSIFSSALERIEQLEFELAQRNRDMTEMRPYCR